MTAPQTSAPSAADTVSPEDAARRARDFEKQKLILSALLAKDRIAGLKQLVDDYETRLQSLMGEDHESKLVNDEGLAAKTDPRRNPKVTNPELLAQRFPLDLLASYVKPDVAFIEAAKKAGIAWEDCISEGKGDPGFTIHRHRSREAEEYKQRIIEETKDQAHEIITALVDRMLGRKKNP